MQRRADVHRGVANGAGGTIGQAVYHVAVCQTRHSPRVHFYLPWWSKTLLKHGKNLLFVLAVVLQHFGNNRITLNMFASKLCHSNHARLTSCHALKEVT